MTFQLSLPDSIHERLSAQASLLGSTPEELATKLLDKALPKQQAASLDLFAPAGSTATPGAKPARTSSAPGGGSSDGTWRLWADGACSGNPGPGGFGVVVQGPDGEEEWSKGYQNTTNNRMEMRGAIEALERVPKGAAAILHTDSRYVVDAIEKKWVDGWRKRGWRKADGGEVKNVDLWELMVAAMAGKSVKIRWVEGHAGNALNERCDRLAVAATRQPGLLPDKHG